MRVVGHQPDGRDCDDTTARVAIYVLMHVVSSLLVKHLTDRQQVSYLGTCSHQCATFTFAGGCRVAASYITDGVGEREFHIIKVRRTPRCSGQLLALSSTAHTAAVAKSCCCFDGLLDVNVILHYCCIPVVCPDDMKNQSRRQVSGAKQPFQRMEDGGASRHAEARIGLITLVRARHVSPRRARASAARAAVRATK